MLIVNVLNTKASSCTPIALRCDYLSNPIGIDTPQPRLSWQLNDLSRGARQTAYRIWVGTDSAAVSSGNGNSWDSGQIQEDKQLVTYQGKALQPFTRYFWRVEVWDKNQQNGGSSATATFEMGMMDSKNWKGAWISDGHDVTLKPAPYFRKDFGVSKKIKSARAYIAVGGLYELYINGTKVGNHRLDPMYTRFDRRILYITYDITQSLKNGKNAVGVLLGNGWYNHQSTAVWYFHQAPWRARPTFCLDMRITYEDNSIETISSGSDWKTSLGPLVFNSIYTAEHYDARLEQPGWNTTSFDDSKWKPVELRAAPSPSIVAQQLHPIRNVEKVTAQRIKKINDTTYIFDLGRNISGVSQLTVRGNAGTAIRLKHGERLYPSGLVDLSNIDIHYRPMDQTDPFQTDIIILKGSGEETFMPRFNYKGFQYVQLTSSQPITVTQNSLVGYFMHSDVPVTGSLRSSNPVLNKISWATNNSYLSNLFGYPTDCPQREKNGWTGDAHIAIETGLYGFDGITIYEKWMADHRDEQQPNGVLPAIIPTSGWGYQWANGPDWTSTIAIIPWNIYLFYGDTKLLADCYPNIKRYVDHIDQISPEGLTSWGLGDWVPVKSKSPVEFTSSTYYYIDVSILANAANLLGKTSDYNHYQSLATKIRNAINTKYLDPETGIYGSGLQTELSAALYWGLVPEDLRGKVAANLARRVEADGFHLDVGLLGTKTLLNALSENGYADLAYQVALQENYPSWGWWIKNGATTLYENWAIDAQSDISLNHIMFGEIGAWFYKALGGIKPDPVQPGFKNIVLKPNFVGGLTQLEATHNGPYGTIRSSWTKMKGKIIYQITIPANSTASLFIANSKNVYESGKLWKSIAELSGSEKVYSLTSGSYVLEIK